MKLVKESKRGGKVSEHSLCKKPCALSLAWPVYHSSPRLRVMTFAVSVRGALGSEAQTFIRQLSYSSRLGSRALCLTGCLTRRARELGHAGVCPSAPLGDHLLGPQGARCRQPSEHLLRRGGRLR